MLITEFFDNIGKGADQEEIQAFFSLWYQQFVSFVQGKHADDFNMDALIPAVEAIEACASDDVAEILAAGAEAAVAGAEATVEMKANFGRARNYGERSIGSMDSGAASLSCMFKAFADAIK
jgi:dihydroxyacetone kinase-like protein